MPSPSPFLRVILPRAASDIRDAALYLARISPDAGLLFSARLREEIDLLCERWGEGVGPLTDEDATLFYSRPAFVHTFRTGQQRRRRSSTGVWRIVYDVTDADGDGAPDTLRIVAVRHGAARPLSVEYEDEL